MINLSSTTSSLRCTFRLIMIITLVWVSVNVSSIPTLSTALGSYQVTMQLSGTNMTGSMPLYYYTFTPYDAITDVLESSAVLSSFQYNTKPQFMFRLSLPVYNSTTSQFNIGVQVLSPCNFLFLKFFIIYISQQSVTYFQVQAVNHTCLVANGTIGTSKTEAITFPTRLYVGPGDVGGLKTIAFVSSILLQNSVGATTSAFGFSLNTPPPTVTGFTATVTLTTPAAITEIFVTILIIKTNIMPEEQMPYIFAGYKVDQSQLIATAGACSSAFGIPATYGGTGYDRNCTVGLTEANDDYNTPLPRKIDFDSTTGPNFTTCSNSAQANTALIQELYYGIVCLYKGSCPNSTFYFSKTLPDCKLCSTINVNCVTCNVSQCFSCVTLFYPTGMTCLPCTQLHCIDCLTVNTCAKCDNTSYVNTLSVCAPCTNLAFCTLCYTNVTCISCVNNTYAPDVTGTCTICYLLLIECLTCVNYYTCSNCNISYYISAGGSCFPCTSAIGFCNMCTNASYCSSCQSGYFLTNSNVTCTFCGTIFPNCALCSSNASCTMCQLGYYANNATTCFACTLTACINCTSNTTCVQCQTTYYLTASQTCQTCTARHCISCPNATSCLGCEPDFTLTNNSCNCTTGWQITNVCISVLGCVTAVKISNVSTCVFCDNLANFIISGTTCICKTGYKLTISSICVTVCGDSLIYGSQTCDDGNTVSGDGCSSTCIQQTNYKCFNAVQGYKIIVPNSKNVSTVGGYQCMYKANFTISLQYIWRDPSSNSGSYYFSISPTTPNFNKQSLLNYFVLTLYNNTGYKVTGYTYLDGIIQCDVTFVQNIENVPATLYLNFDTNLFNTTDFTYSFLSTGTNAPLIVSGYTSHIQYLTIGSYVVLGLACLILLLSVIYEKMIAIETVNYLQLLVFCKLVYIQEDLLMDTGLKTLDYIAGYNLIGQNLAQTHTLPQPYRRLNFNNDFLLNFETGLLLMAISLVILIIFRIYRWRFLSKYQKTCASKDDYRLKEQTLNSKARFIYERLIFLVACITLFQAFAALRIQARTLDSDSHYNYFLVNLLTLIFAVVYTLGVLTYEVINTGKAHEWMAPFCSYSPYYVGYYVVWALIMTPIMAVGQIFLGMKAIFICGGIIFINLIVLVIWRPYNQAIHNIGIILNHIVVLGFLGFEAMMSIENVGEPVQFMASYTLLGLILLMEVLAMIRIYFAYRPPKKEVPKLMRNQVAQMEEESKIVIENLEKDYLGRANKKKLGNRQGDDDDYLRRLKARLKQEIKENQNVPTEEL